MWKKIKDCIWLALDIYLVIAFLIILIYITIRLLLGTAIWIGYIFIPVAIIFIPYYAYQAISKALWIFAKYKKNVTVNTYEIHINPKKEGKDYKYMSKDY